MRLDKNRVASLIDANYGSQMLREGDRAQAGNSEKDQIWSLLLTEIEPDPNQPRRYFDEKALKDLADDIERRGVLQPILVRQIGEKYQIIVGERRWRASQIANKTRVPCIIKEMTIAEIRQAQLVENIIRQGISDIERGQALHLLYEEMKNHDRKVTWEHVSQMVGISRMRINHLYNLSKLPQEIIEMIQQRRLSGSHGVELTRIEAYPEKQIQIAEESCRIESGTGNYLLSVSEVRKRISTILETPHPVRPRSPLSPDQVHTHTQDLSCSLRPDLPKETLEELKEMAQHILRFLDQDKDGVL